MSLSEVLCSDEDLNFGECNASKFEAQISDIEDISGLKIQVYENISGYEAEVPLFEGYIDSAMIQPDHTSRTIIAYDDIYYHSNDNVSEWYDNLFTSTAKPEYKGAWGDTEKYVSGNVVQCDGVYYKYLCKGTDQFSVTTVDDNGSESTKTYLAVDYCVGKNPKDILEDEYASQYVQELDVYNPYNYGSITVKQFRDSLMKYVGITQEDVTLLNDSVFITKTIDSNELKFIDCAKAVCQMNACFGHMSESGVFRYIQLGEDAIDYSGNYKASASTYEEFSVKPIDSIRIYDNAGVVSTVYGSGSNPWNLINNFLLYGPDEEELRGISKILFDYVSTIVYVPASIQALISLPVSMGDKVIVTTHEGATFTSYVLNNTLSGAQLTSQVITAYGNETRNNTGSLSDSLALLESKTTAIVEEVYNKLTAEYAEIKTVKGNLADYKTVVAKQLSAYKADIEILDTVKLNAEEAGLTYAKISDLEANYLKAKDAEISYANIDFSNIGEAAMEYLYANSGLIRDVVVDNGTITGHLIGVTISGDLIEGNTIVAEKLVIKGEDGLYYKLNTDGVTTEAEQTDYNSLSGTVIQAKSITAEKISVSDLVAFDATIGGFTITEDSLYSGVKTSATNTTRGIFLGNDGQIAFGDDTNYVRYFKDTESNTWKLEMTAQTIKMGGTGKTIEEELTDIREDVTAELNEIRDEVTCTLYIGSSNGTCFKNDNISTVLSVTIYRGSERITDITALQESLGSTASLQWSFKRIGDDTVYIIDPSDIRISDSGFRFTINADDVDASSTFFCDLII